MSLVDLQGERLTRATEGVGGGDEDRVTALGSRDAGDGGGAVNVVGEGAPAGMAPPWVSAGAGNPSVVTVNVPVSPAVKAVDAWPVTAGAWFTTRVKVCVAVPRSFLAVMVTMYVPPSVALGFPEMVPVPLALSVKVTADGSVPFLVSDGTGNPVVVTVNGAAVEVGPAGS